MEKLTITTAMLKLAKAINKPCMYVSFDSDEFLPVDIVKEVPCINMLTDYQLLNDGFGIIVFDTSEEMYKEFKKIKYKSPVVYALTCNTKGEFEDENT